MLSALTFVLAGLLLVQVAHGKNSTVGVFGRVGNDVVLSAPDGGRVIINTVDINAELEILTQAFRLVNESNNALRASLEAQVVRQDRP